jgi:hypothetical protein
MNYSATSERVGTIRSRGQTMPGRDELSKIVHTDTDKSSSTPRGHAEWSAASNLR